MRLSLPAPLRIAAVLGAALLLAGCASAATSGSDEADAPASSPSVPTTEHQTIDSGTELGLVPVPLPSGEVTAPTTVLDRGTGPELCIGSVAMSLPPQCTGPAIDGWDWTTIDGWEESRGVRWGDFTVQGTFDGERFAITAAPIPLTQWPVAADDDTAPGPVTEEEHMRLLEVFDAGLGSTYLSAGWANGSTHMHVLYDDGTLQQHLDAVYGPNVVHVTSALVDVQP